MTLARCLLLLLLPCLAACENTGASYMVDGEKDHSISLLREQRWFWGSEVKQMIVAARYPVCQQRYAIADGVTGKADIELYSVNDVLYVVHQGKDWWGVGTEKCELQAFATPPAKYGDLLGRFRMEGADLRFVPVAASAPAAAPK